MNNRSVGDKQEDKAADYLEKNGFRILERNFRVRQGEIDIIGYDREVLVFVEVKYRKNTKSGAAEEAVDFRKQRQICKVALFYLNYRKLGMDIPCRYDVVAIAEDHIKWYKNAFEHCL